MNKDFIEIDGFKLGYKIEGSGIPAIVIGSSIYYPRTFSQNLRKHLKFIFIDHRGFVENKKDNIDESKYKLDVLLDDVEFIRKQLKLEKIIVIGHSAHAYMAIEYAKKYPQNVSAVILIAFGPDHSEKSHMLAEQYFNDLASIERKDKLNKDLELLPSEIQKNPDQRFIIFCKKLGAKSWYDYKFDSSELWKGVYVNMQIIDYIWGEVFKNVDITKDLENFDKPIFIGLGLFDFLVAPFFTWYPLRSKFKDLTFKIFAKSSHTPQYEDPETFDKEVINFIKKIK